MLSKDPIFQIILEKEQLTSQLSISRLWNQLSQENTRQFQEVNQLLIAKMRTARHATEMIFNLDSSKHLDTFENQEKTDYNATTERMVIIRLLPSKL